MRTQYLICIPSYTPAATPAYPHTPMPPLYTLIHPHTPIRPHTTILNMYTPAATAAAPEAAAAANSMSIYI